MGKKQGKRPPGRPRLYEERPGKEGAPTLSVRLAPLVHSHITNHPEKPRAYIERLVTEDAERTGEVLGGAGKSRDAPGQLLIDGTEVGESG